jgi:ornithine--oxo-acid transaminase
MYSLKTPHQTADYLQLEDKYNAHNYHPLPVVLKRGQGVFCWDIDDKRYFDFLSGYSAVNQGHCHPKIIDALTKQASQLTLTSRAFYNDKLGPFAQFITSYFDYDKVLPMNTGVEAVETAIKLCRKWAYEKKGIQENQANIIVFEENFHGRTSTVISFSSDLASKSNFGPFMPGFITVPYNDVEALRNSISQPNLAGVLIEPIQGEAGVIVPDEGYLEKVAKLCKEAGVLFMADEIQTGLGRTGKKLACDHENIRPDILILGKALSGGVLPISAVLADDEIMMNIKPGQHGSTFGGNPLACAVAQVALEVLEEEGLATNAAMMGQLFREKLSDLKNPHLKTIRGKGLLNAIVIEHPDADAAWNLCLAMKENGLLAKPTHGDKIRLAPPLCITKEQIEESVEILRRSLEIFN